MRGLMYVLLVTLLLELARSRRQLPALALALLAVLAVGALALANDLDLLGVALLAIYSSVFIFLTLLALYFLGDRAATPLLMAGPALILSLGVLAVWVSGALPLFNASKMPPLWLDLYSQLGDFHPQSASLVHLLFYRLCVWETLLLNLYLLFAVILGVVLLSLVTRGGLPSAWTAFSRGARGLWFLRNWRLRGANKLRRQVRHRNSSLVRFKQ